MKKLFTVMIFVLFSFTLFAQTENDSSKTETAPSPQPPQTYHKSPSKIYYGGSLGFNFWGDTKRISVEPLIGYKITPQLSAGVKLRFEWISYEYNFLNEKKDINTNNYGGSVFARYRVIPQLYLHAEYAYLSYEYAAPTLSDSENTERNGIPFLLLGGGYTQRIGGNAWAYVEALWDVIQDEKSPYKSGEPFISVGAGIGF